MPEKQIPFFEAEALLTSNGYTLEWKENHSYAFYHPRNPRSHILVIQVHEMLSSEMTKKVLEAVERLKEKS